MENIDHILLIMNSINLYSMENNDLFDWINLKIKEIRLNNCMRKIIIRPKDINLNMIKKEIIKLLLILKIKK